MRAALVGGLLESGWNRGRISSLATLARKRKGVRPADEKIAGYYFDFQGNPHEFVENK